MFALTPWVNRMLAPLPRTETPFTLIPEEFEKLFNRFFTIWPVMETPEWPFRWGMTMEEKEKEFLVKVELPGFKPEGVKVEIVGERLTVEAEHKEPAEKGKEETERVHAKRTITLPPGAEVEKAEATYRNGVLEVHVPRKPEAVGRKIPVKGE